MSVILPRDDARCGWYKLLPTPKPALHCKGKQKSDVVIIGGGFVGLAAAREYAKIKPDHRVILVEALRIGQGASGRNSGFLIDLPHKRDLEIKDLERKQKIHNLNLEAINSLQDTVTTYNIKCDWKKSGKYQVAVGERGERYLTEYRKLLDDFSINYKEVIREDLKNTLGTDYYSSAIYTTETVLMQPAALVRGLAETMPSNVEVFEETPALKINKNTNSYQIEIQDGSITCKKIILANNIFAKEFGFLKTQMIPTMTYASMTEPLSSEQMQIFRHEQSWGATPADHGGTTLRLTPDQRIVIRNHYQYVPKYHDNYSRYNIRKSHIKGIIDRYPNLKDINIEYTWGGACALSRNFQAFFGALESNIYYSGIHQSVGATRGSITGKLLAHLALDQQSESLSNMIAISKKPSINLPEPFLGIGVRTRMVMARVESKTEL